MQAVVLHPDLGLGGAERLIVDATCALIDRGYQTEVFTSYYDQHRCFDETRRFNIVVLANWIPRSIMGRCHALMAYIKMIYIATYLILYRRQSNLIICDQVSVCIPILKFGLRHCKIIFYCHFPDQLLTTRETLIKTIYRKPLDYLEEWSTGLADIIFVNSHFTSKVVKKTFRSMKNRTLEILHPCVRMDQPRRSPMGNHIENLVESLKGRYVFLSLNRFEKKKNIGLAIEALHECLSGDKVDRGGQVMKAHLIVAGGHDERLHECVQYYAELQLLVNALELSSRVTFVKSPNDVEKEYLLQTCNAVIYTPLNEHFGIVPLEAMLFEKPVIASASGGPLETVQSGVTGFLCDTNKEAFASAMVELMQNPQLGVDMGEAGFKRVKDNFSFEAFSDKLFRQINKSNNK